MTASWPKWQTVRADEVRAVLSEDELGPWVSPGVCVGAFLWDPHPPEAPHFFHCRDCMDQVRSRHPVPKPNRKRDLGLCIKCGDLAEPDHELGRLGQVACVEAEKLGITVARLSTRKWCAKCDPYSRPWCEWKGCRKIGRKARTLPKGCCGYTDPVGRNLRPHCQRCCGYKEAFSAARRRLARKAQVGQQCARRKCQFCGDGPRAPAVDCRHSRQIREGPKGVFASSYNPHCQEACNWVHKRHNERNAAWRRRGGAT